MFANYKLVFAFLNAIPKVNPSAHLWTTTTDESIKHLSHVYSRPIASPSNIAWMPKAIYKIKGAKLQFIKFVFSIFYSELCWWWLWLRF